MKTELFIFCDGGARGNPGPAGIGFVVKNSRGEMLAKISRFIGKATNNVAEYKAVIAALLWLKKYESTSHFSLFRPKDDQPLADTFHFYLDSQLVVNQLKGIYKIKNPTLRSLIIQAKNLEAQLKTPISYQLVPREKNLLADALVNQALDESIGQ